MDAGRNDRGDEAVKSEDRLRTGAGDGEENAADGVDEEDEGTGTSGCGGRNAQCGHADTHVHVKGACGETRMFFYKELIWLAARRTVMKAHVEPILQHFKFSNALGTNVTARLGGKQARAPPVGPKTHLVRDGT